MLCGFEKERSCLVLSPFVELFVIVSQENQQFGQSDALKLLDFWLIQNFIFDQVQKISSVSVLVGEDSQDCQSCLDRPTN